MSTYNGEKWLAEQIDSILAQKYVHVELFIRDDGSTDNTRKIISDFADNHENFHVNFGENIGWVKSFFTELNVAAGYDYYAFSDQDDVWKPEKLITAVEAIKKEEALHGKNHPVMWHSAQCATDAALNILYVNTYANRVPSLESFLLRRQGKGCSMVFNAKLRECMENLFSMGYRGAHDITAMLVTYIFSGTTIFSSGVYVYHRLHGNNTSTIAMSKRVLLIKALKNLLMSRHDTSKLAKLILELCGSEIAPEVKKTLIVVAEHDKNLLYRLEIVFSPKFRTGNIYMTMAGKLKALLGIL